jgi:hypothetical protein
LWSRVWDFHFTTRAESRRVDEEQVLDQWRDSRTHGSAIAGQGVGLPRARVLAAFNNGILSLEPRTTAAVDAFNKSASSTNSNSTSEGARPKPLFLHREHRTCFQLDLLT